MSESEQEAIAAWIDELESERKWTALFNRSQVQLRKLAEEACAEHARGETEPWPND